MSVSNEKYELTREDPAMKGMADLPSVKEDADYVWEQFAKFEGFEDATKYRETDLDYKSFAKLCRKICTEVYENQSHDENTLVFFYYGGHGMEKDGQLQAVTNQKESKKRNY